MLMVPDSMGFDCGRDRVSSKAVYPLPKICINVWFY
jgi:hypothetical protein